MLPNILNVILQIFSKTKTVADVIGLPKKDEANTGLFISVTEFEKKYYLRIISKASNL